MGAKTGSRTRLIMTRSIIPTPPTTQTFIHPRFFMEDNRGPIPYSIHHSAWLCSCCWNCFRCWAANFHKKLVAPCPGATIFARLKPDRYLLVENTETEQVAT